MAALSLDIDDPNLSLHKHVCGLKPGDRIVLCRRGRPEVEIRHCSHPSGRQRTSGVAERIVEVPDSFFEPLPDDFIDAFYDAPILSVHATDAGLESRPAPVPRDAAAGRADSPAIPDGTDSGQVSSDPALDVALNAAKPGRLLLDTVTFLWLAAGDPRLSASARRLVCDPSTEVFLSSASVWEIAIKYGIGRLHLNEPPEQFVARHRGIHSIESLLVDEEAALHVRHLPNIHKDPFDRMLIAQAIKGWMTLVTPDSTIGKYPVPVIW